MQSNIANVGSLVDEYQSLTTESLTRNHEDVNRELLEAHLCNHSDWTPEAAVTLVGLARDYGSFMLRNALALSIALDVEDGELEF